MKAKLFFSSISAVVFACTLCACAGRAALPEKGVWWWGSASGYEARLDFAKVQGVTEIYLSDPSFDEDVAALISDAGSSGIDVYFLCGEYQWIEDMSGAIALVEAYMSFCERAESAFSGIHFDVEPHQHPDWSDEARRTDLICAYLAFVAYFAHSERYEDITFDYDIPFWYDGYEVTFQGVSAPAYRHVIDMADRVFVMSYRDSAEEILQVAADELDYAKSKGKQIFLCVETAFSSEGDNITFYEEGRAAMDACLRALQERIFETYGASFTNYGISIHHMQSWLALQ